METDKKSAEKKNDIDQTCMMFINKNDTSIFLFWNSSHKTPILMMIDRSTKVSSKFEVYKV
jgi:hypothetical protein